LALDDKKTFTDEAPAVQKEALAPKPGESVDTFVNNLVKSNDVVIFSKTTCPFCVKVKELFKSINRDYVSVELDQISTLIFFD